MDTPGMAFMVLSAGFSCARPAPPSSIIPIRIPAPDFRASRMSVLSSTLLFCVLRVLCAEVFFRSALRLMMVLLFNALGSCFNPRHHVFVVLVWQHRSEERR